MSRGRNARGGTAGLVAALVVLVLLLLFFGRSSGDGAAGREADRAAPPPLAEMPTFSSQDAADHLDSASPQWLAASPSEFAVAAAAPGATSLRVRVLWAADRAPAAGIGLQVHFWQEPGGGRRNVRLVTTDARGEWFASPVPEGHVAAYTDRNKAEGTKIEPGQAAVIEIVLPAGFHVRGVVQDAEGQVVANADIWLSMSQNSSEGQVVTRSDAQGRFVLRDLPVKGRQVLAARSSRHAPSPSRPVEAALGETREITLVLGGECGAVRGVVLDPDDKPVPGARVRIGKDFGFHLDGAVDGSSNSPPFELRCDGQGAFVAEGVPVGVHPIVAAAPGWSPTNLATVLVDGERRPATGLVVEAGKTLAVSLKLQPSASLVGIARDETGRPVSWATIEAWTELDAMNAEANTAEDGRYELRDLPLGSIEVTAQHKDYGRVSKRLRFEAGKSVTWDPPFASTALIAGTLLDAHGMPCPSTWVSAKPGEGGRSPGAGAPTDATGHFEIRGLELVPHDIQVHLRETKASIVVARKIEVGRTDLVGSPGTELEFAL